MLHTRKETLYKIKDKSYKIRIQERFFWAGTSYYHCKVKKLNSRKTIIKEDFSREDIKNGYIEYYINNDTLYIDVWNKSALKWYEKRSIKNR